MATKKTNPPTGVRGPAGEPPPEAKPRLKPKTPPAQASFIDKGLRLLSSVRFGIILLLLLLVCCLIGMFIMQRNVQGFATYYAKLSPATRQLFESLGFFDIYHSWYFVLLLALTGLSIILSSIDRFPAAWAYIRKPKLSASPRFINAQAFQKEVREGGSVRAVADRIAGGWRQSGLRPRLSGE